MSNQPVTNILIVGVGGQGVLLAGELICDVIALSGIDVKKSEVHGMAQRGGVVSSHVRYGEKVFSPLIPSGEADVLLSFEQAEALRWMHFVRPGGRIIVNTQKLVPPVAFLKEFSYPENPIEMIRSRRPVITVAATEMAREMNHARGANMILLGVVSQFLQLSEEFWEKGIQNRVPEGTAAINIQAFQKGRTTRYE